MPSQLQRKSVLRATFGAPLVWSLAWIAVLAACQSTPEPEASQSAQAAEEVHPKKAIYADLASWPATRPGNTPFANFQPFRAVYDRQYRQHSGPNAGDIRRDRVIISAEEVAWDGRRALSIALLDSGIAEQSDTNARALVQISDLKTLELLFEIGPIPGKAKDYYLARAETDQLLVSRVTTETQALEPQKRPISDPGFGPGTWAIATMDLEKNTKIRLAPYHSPKTTNVVSASDHGRVLGQESFTDGSGHEHQAWVVETGAYYKLSSPKVQHLYLIHRPPYYLGTENVNLETGEKSRFVWLRGVQILAGDSIPSQATSSGRPADPVGSGS